jgi:hypothetical protein
MLVKMITVVAVCLCLCWDLSLLGVGVEPVPVAVAHNGLLGLKPQEFSGPGVDSELASRHASPRVLGIDTEWECRGEVPISAEIVSCEPLAVMGTGEVVNWLWDFAPPELVHLAVDRLGHHVERGP